MKIIVEDKKTGKAYLVKGADGQFMVYKKPEVKVVDGKKVSVKGTEVKSEWTFTGLYPSSIGSAVYHCINLILSDPDDPDDVHIEAEKARIKFGKILKDRLDQIEAHILEEVANA